MPQISGINDQSIQEDGSFTYDVIATDVDGDPLAYSVNDTPNATSHMSDNVLSVIPDQDYYGTIELAVIVSDGEFIDSTDFSLEVTPVNDAPILEDISNQFIMENQILDIEFVASDVDGDSLIYDYYISSGYASAEINGDVLSIIPNQNWYGEITMTFTVSDGEYYVQEDFFIEVIEIDDPPVAYDVSSSTSNPHFSKTDIRF